MCAKLVSIVIPVVYCQCHLLECTSVILFHNSMCVSVKFYRAEFASPVWSGNSKRTAEKVDDLRAFLEQVSHYAEFSLKTVPLKVDRFY